MDRRRLLRGFAGHSFLRTLFAAPAGATAAPMSRVRPGDPNWPRDETWADLGRRLDGHLVRVESPFTICADDANACARLFAELKNPYYLGDDVAMTQSLGWVGAWTSRPSVFAVAAES